MRVIHNVLGIGSSPFGSGNGEGLLGMFTVQVSSETEEHNQTRVTRSKEAEARLEISLKIVGRMDVAANVLGSFRVEAIVGSRLARGGSAE
jgi:hypothetical protein